MTSLSGEAINCKRYPNISVTDVPALSLSRAFCPSSSFTAFLLLTSSLPFPHLHPLYLVTLSHILFPSLSCQDFLCIPFDLPHPHPPPLSLPCWGSVLTLIERLSDQGLMPLWNCQSQAKAQFIFLCKCVSVYNIFNKSRCICMFVFVFPKFVCAVYTVHKFVCLKMPGIRSGI